MPPALHKKNLAQEKSCCKLRQVGMTDMHFFVQVNLYKFVVEVSCTCVTGINLSVMDICRPDSVIEPQLSLRPTTRRLFDLHVAYMILCTYGCIYV